MLTRLKVTGFKNLIDVDLRLGPFTCIAGPNGAGKSNLFDLIAFMSALADRPLVEAARTVRGARGRGGSLRNLFLRVGDEIVEDMSITTEMVISPEGMDDLGQKARASMTYLRYTLKLRYRPEDPTRGSGGLEIVHEELDRVRRAEARQALGFPCSRAWLESTVSIPDQRRAVPYISMEKPNGEESPLGEGGERDAPRTIRLHQDRAEGGEAIGGGRPRRVLASALPRTVLSSVNDATEFRTVVLARREMQSWRQLHLEPTALRSPDEFTSPRSLGVDGAHIPATLLRLARVAEAARPKEGSEALYARVANRLSELIRGVKSVSVDIDERRELLSVLLTDLQRTSYSAESLSDGTLRFLALAVLEEDPESRGLLCMEEPENGIHPARVPAMLALVQALATDTAAPVAEDNPLRQVIINTHSPSVVAEVPDASLLVAREVQKGVDGRFNGKKARCTEFAALAETWRTREGAGPILSRGELLQYLNPLQGEVESPAQDVSERSGAAIERPSPRVRERQDYGDPRQLSLFLGAFDPSGE